MNKLKPCPFCGGEAHIYTQCSYCRNGCYDAIVVRCDTCKAEMKRCLEISTEKDIIKAWNTGCESISEPTTEAQS